MFWEWRSSLLFDLGVSRIDKALPKVNRHTYLCSSCTLTVQEARSPWIIIDPLQTSAVHLVHNNRFPTPFNYTLLLYPASLFSSNYLQVNIKNSCLILCCNTN